MTHSVRATKAWPGGPLKEGADFSVAGAKALAGGGAALGVYTSNTP